jgi:hypothetical protein
MPTGDGFVEVANKIDYNMAIKPLASEIMPVRQGNIIAYGIVDATTHHPN